MTALRCVPPAYSPLSASAILSALGGDDPRVALATALAHERAVSHAVLVSSGTAALTLALRSAATRRPGLPCVLPAYGCYDLATAALGAGVRVRLYDVDPATLAPDLDSVRHALDGGAAALVVVHPYGIPLDLAASTALARDAGALLVEDAAQAAGARMRGAALGATGDLGVLSFGRGKGESGGGGGALLVRDTDGLDAALSSQVQPAREARAVGAVKLAAQWLLGRPSVYALPSALPFLHLGETVYHAPAPVAAMRASEARVIQLMRAAWTTEAEVRRRIGGDWDAELERWAPDARITAVADGQPGWLRYPVRLPRDFRVDAPARRLGIADPYPMPLHRLGPLAHALDDVGDYPGAEQVTRRLVTLPTHSRMSHGDRARVRDWIRRMFGSP